jgi:hypothetical protein
MPSEPVQTSARSRGDVIREAALLAGVSIDAMLRARALGRMPRPLMIGAGLLTGGAIVALAHLAGADPRGLAGGQPGSLVGLLREGSSARVGEQAN